MNEDKNIEMSDGDLTKLAKMINEIGSKNVSVIKVGNDKIPDSEMVERYKKSNKQLRKKIEKNISQIVTLQTEIRELQVDAYAGTDEVKEAINKGLKKQKKELKEQLERLTKSNRTYQAEIQELKSKNMSLQASEASLKTNVKTLEKEKEELVNKVAELEKEIQVRIDAENRFDIMDL